MSSGSSKMYVWTARDLRKLYEYRKNKLIVSDEVDNLHNFITSFAKCSSSDQDWAQYAADNNVPFVIKSARDKWRKIINKEKNGHVRDILLKHFLKRFEIPKSKTLK